MRSPGDPWNQDNLRDALRAQIYLWEESVKFPDALGMAAERLGQILDHYPEDC